MEQYPNGTLIRYRRKLYCLQQGLDGRIVVDVETGLWFFIKNCEWRTFHVIFEPHPYGPPFGEPFRGI